MGQQTVEAPLLGSGDDKRRRSRALLSLFALISFVFVVLALGGNLNLWELNKGNNYGKKLLSKEGEVVESERAVVAADDGRCSEIGAFMLRQGGHAVDAAVATSLCLGVVNPMASGIGGGAFMLVRPSSSSQTEAFDMRETAPLDASQDMYENDLSAKSQGPLSAGVPGELAGLHEAWLKYGRLPWKSLFQPAIKLAKQGFIIAPYLSRSISRCANKILADPGLKQVFAPNGELLKTGDTCYNVELGLTLEAVAEEGPGVFYGGRIGEKLVRDVRESGGILSMEDLEEYKVRVTDAMAVDAMGFTILGMPPPSSGTLGLSLVLNILDSYGNSDAAKGSIGLHRLIEALKHMFALRMNLGDPEFVNIINTTHNMLSPSFAKKLKQQINDNTTFPSEYYMHRWSQLRDHGTSHFCIVDVDRNAVSMTTTVNYGFGGGFLSPSTGIVLNNEMDDFSVPTEISPDHLPPAPNNFIRPNKRPLSSMTPIIVLKDNHLVGVIGGSGGLYIIPAVVQVFLNHFVLGMEPLDAVQNPRVYHKLIPNVVLYEDWTLIDGEHIELPGERKHFLEQRGHQLQANSGGAICQLVVQTLDENPIKLGRKGNFRNQMFYGTLTAVSDPRKDGRPAAM